MIINTALFSRLPLTTWQAATYKQMVEGLAHVSQIGHFGEEDFSTYEHIGSLGL